MNDCDTRPGANRRHGVPVGGCAAGLAILVGALLIADAIHYDHRPAADVVPASKVMVASPIVAPPSLTPLPAISDQGEATTRPTPDPRVPPDPGIGPFPACWLHPPYTPWPGDLGPCPPRPPGWSPPPGR